MTAKNTTLKKSAFILVLLMILLQAFYGAFAYVDPLSFSNIRGTELFSLMDADWIRIYGSRTLFITLALGYLLFTKNYHALMWCALFGMVMPITDAYLAYEAHASFNVVLKHLVTIVYLFVIFIMLKKITVESKAT